MSLIVLHRVFSLLRRKHWFAGLTEHRVRVEHGEVRRPELIRCGLTERDLYSQLRQRDVFDIAGIAFVLVEPRGALTIAAEPDIAEAVPVGAENPIRVMRRACIR